MNAEGEIPFKCPRCGRSGKAPGSAAGKRIKCGCGDILDFTALAAPPTFEAAKGTPPSAVRRRASYRTSGAGGKHAPPGRKRRALWPWIAVAGACLAACLGGFFLFGQRGAAPEPEKAEKASVDLPSKPPPVLSPREVAERAKVERYKEEFRENRADMEAHHLADGKDQWGPAIRVWRDLLRGRTEEAYLALVEGEILRLNKEAGKEVIELKKRAAGKGFTKDTLLKERWRLDGTDALEDFDGLVAGLAQGIQSMLTAIQKEHLDSGRKEYGAAIKAIHEYLAGTPDEAGVQEAEHKIRAINKSALFELENELPNLLKTGSVTPSSLRNMRSRFVGTDHLKEFEKLAAKWYALDPDR